MREIIIFIFHGYQEPSFACQFKFPGLHKVEELFKNLDQSCIILNRDFIFIKKQTHFSFPCFSSSYVQQFFSCLYRVPLSFTFWQFLLLLFSPLKDFQSAIFLVSQFSGSIILFLRQLFILLRLEPFTTIFPLAENTVSDNCLN